MSVLNYHTASIAWRLSFTCKNTLSEWAGAVQGVELLGLISGLHWIFSIVEGSASISTLTPVEEKQ